MFFRGSSNHKHKGFFQEIIHIIITISPKLDDSLHFLLFCSTKIKYFYQHIEYDPISIKLFIYPLPKHMQRLMFT